MISFQSLNKMIKLMLNSDLRLRHNNFLKRATKKGSLNKPILQKGEKISIRSMMGFNNKLTILNFLQDGSGAASSPMNDVI